MEKKKNYINSNQSSFKQIDPQDTIVPMEEEIEKHEEKKNDNNFSEINARLETNSASNNTSIDQSINSINEKINNNNSCIEHPLFKFYKTSQNINPLFISEYYDETYKNLLLDEKYIKLKINYMNMQDDINETMRTILIDWIIEVDYHCHFKRKTLYQTILIIDLFLSQNPIKKDHLQLLGIASLLIACKENEVYYPKLEEFINITNSTFNKKELLEMEILVLQTLNFDILYPTSDEFYNILSKIFNFNKTQKLLGEYFMDSSLLDYKILKNKPSVIAASCAYLVMKFFGIKGNNQLFLSKIIAEDESKHEIINECAKELCFLVKNLSNSHFKATKEKYTLKEYDKVALLFENK